jgi:hypothetical protein
MSLAGMRKARRPGDVFSKISRSVDIINYLPLHLSGADMLPEGTKKMIQLIFRFGFCNADEYFLISVREKFRQWQTS